MNRKKNTKRWNLERFKTTKHSRTGRQHSRSAELLRIILREFYPKSHELDSNEIILGLFRRVTNTATSTDSLKSKTRFAAALLPVAGDDVGF